ncbi:tRNA lysidine(34) synthetase TilS [Wielerella bovis]|uniref:tRNA lysidine(34) synthetase TilS n=1 Tax=Wielerella bovis TaxID=2917790 RepID=UPI002019BC32|nr:tRNA lysidine(34) synthetase TilS [Wielerella bovis]MCG7657200.1 tRNA lysidine(34) synthetase TilS [Wielerella bovis]MCG7659423.1 tRNA lysidine(34) synthetase TilS [Wielerella bovis]
MLKTFLSQLPDLYQQKICVGFSGGADSIVLLHLLTQARAHGKIGSLSAVHVHHGLSSHADDWLRFCQQICHDWRVDFSAERVQLNPKKQGIEAAARAARYAVYAQQNCDKIALAHHRDDQLETFWLAALRGGGLRALAAMSSERALNERITLWRPLLSFSRADIEDYAAQNRLNYVHDASNDDPSLLRNWVRHNMQPEIAQRVPQYDKHLLASIALLQDELALLDEIIAQDWADLHAATGQFSRVAWFRLPQTRQKQMLREFAQRHYLGTPRRASVQDFARVLREADANAQWSLPHGQAVLYRGVLFPVRHDFANDWAWTQRTEKGSLKNILPKMGLTWRGDAPEFSGCIRAAQRDDVMRMQSGRKSVWQILQEAGVPPFAREKWAVAVDNDGMCVAVANIRSDACLQGAILWHDDLLGFQAA